MTDADAAQAADTPPDRLSVNPRSPYYDAALLERGVGVRFKGAEKTNVEEYCVSEGWVRLTVGNTLDRKGAPLPLMVLGRVAPYFRSEVCPGAGGAARFSRRPCPWPCPGSAPPCPGTPRW